jgi:hypothetical protein
MNSVLAFVLCTFQLILTITAIPLEQHVLEAGTYVESGDLDIRDE